MRTVGLAPLGGEAKVVEGDETYLGEIEPRVAPRRTSGPSLALPSAVGEARTVHVYHATSDFIFKIVGKKRG